MDKMITYPARSVTAGCLRSTRSAWPDVPHRRPRRVVPRVAGRLFSPGRRHPKASRACPLRPRLASDAARELGRPRAHRLKLQLGRKASPPSRHAGDRAEPGTLRSLTCLARVRPRSRMFSDRARQACATRRCFGLGGGGRPARRQLVLYFALTVCLSPTPPLGPLITHAPFPRRWRLGSDRSPLLHVHDPNRRSAGRSEIAHRAAARATAPFKMSKSECALPGEADALVKTSRSPCCFDRKTTRAST